MTEPDRVVYPDSAWRTITPNAAGFDAAGWERWLAKQHPRGSGKYGEDHSGGRWGAVIVRGGYRVATFGDPGRGTTPVDAYPAAGAMPFAWKNGASTRTPWRVMPL